MHNGVCDVGRKNTSVRYSDGGRAPTAETAVKTGIIKPASGRQHPAAILGYTGGCFAAAAAPVAAYIASVLSGSPIAVDRKMLLSFIPFFIYACCAVTDYLNKLHRTGNNGISYTSGIFTQHVNTVSSRSIGVVSLVRTPLKALFGAITLKIMTSGGEEYGIVLSRKEAVSTASALTGCGSQSGGNDRPSSMLSILIHALSGSGIISGLLAAIILLNRVGRVTGQSFAAELLDEAGKTVKNNFSFLPDIFSLIIGALAVGWALSVLSAVFRLARHTLRNEKEHLVISHGAVIRKTDIIGKSSVTLIESRASLLMSLFRRRCCLIYYTGGKNGQCLVPSETIKKTAGLRAEIFGASGRKSCAVYPDKGRRSGEGFRVSGYLSAVLCGLLSVRSGLLSCTAGAAALLLFLRAFAQSRGVKSPGICVYGAYVRMDCMSGMSARSCYFPRGRISAITVSRSPLDLLRGTCTVTARVSGTKKPARCGLLPYERAANVAARIVGGK